MHKKDILWAPPEHLRNNARITSFMTALSDMFTIELSNYNDAQ